jgi:hypothetical protein
MLRAIVFFPNQQEATMTSFRIIALAATMALIVPSLAFARGGGHSGGNNVSGSGNGTGNTVHTNVIVSGSGNGTGNNTNIANSGNGTGNTVHSQATRRHRGTAN